MLDWLRYRYQLGRLLRKKARTRRLHGQAWQKARAEQQSTSEQDKLASLARADLQLVDEDIAVLQTDYLVNQAIKYSIELPPIGQGSGWVHSGRTGLHHLNTQEIMKLRSAIRSEHKERSELSRAWLTGLTGLIGVLIGLLAIILGRR